ncbi:hypothetical protein [Spirosoma rigui]|uniref:hypothetical protein n=1 Tax=Spirosoma rigui TaxID=564064 RepID=UPI0009AF313F|nr:hypothetical protein [Spirosoma rigui]
MNVTIEVEDQHKLETLMDWLRENKFLDEVTIKSTKPGSVDGGQEAGWLKLTEESLRDDWEAPENDMWDEF